MTANRPQSVVVIGGGVVGLCTAYFFRRRGADVTVIEADHVGAGASHGNAGWITPALAAPLPAPGTLAIALRSILDRDTPLYVRPKSVLPLLPWLFGIWRHSTAARHLAGMQATSLLAAPTMELYDSLLAEELDLDYSAKGMIFVSKDQDKVAGMLASLAPLGDFGYELPTGVLAGDELRELEPALGESASAGFVLGQERAIKPDALVRSLAKRLVELGVTIVEATPVSGFDVRSGEVRSVVTQSGWFETDCVVIAAGMWSKRLARHLGLRLPMQPGKGYSFSIRPEVQASHCLYFLDAKAGATPFGDELRLAGTMELSGMSTALDCRRVDAIERSSRPYLAGWHGGGRTDEWAGLRPVGIDGLPIIGGVPGVRNAFMNTGHSMLGVTLGPASAVALADYVFDGRSDVLRPFRPDRFRRAQRRRSAPPVTTAT